MASKKPSGLGRGLGALLGDDVLKTETTGALYLPITDVESNSSQPRKNFDEEALAQLADSIREHGIIQPLTVRKLTSGYYQIIAGERRWRAARMAGLKEVPVTVIDADDRKAAELAMIENLQREDLDPVEEAMGYRSLTQQYHMTQEEAAQRVGKSRSAVTNALRLLELEPSVQKKLQEKALSAGHARALIPLSPALQVRAANAIIDGGLSVRQAEALAKRLAAEKKPRKETPVNQVDYTAEAQKELSSKLGRGVRIVTGRKKGRIELEYYGLDDLLLHSLGLCQLGGVLLGLAHQHADLLGKGVAVGTELVGFGDGGATLGVQVNDLIYQGQLGVLKLFLDVFLDSVGIFPDETNVEHMNSLLFCDSEYQTNQCFT